MVKGVKGFLGFANFYRWFIEGFSDKVQPLTELTHKDKKFYWSEEVDKAFKKLKTAFVSALYLVYFDYDKLTRIETDSSSWCIRGTLQQLSAKGVWTPCVFFSKKNSSAEYNYEIHNKELFAVIQCLNE